MYLITKVENIKSNDLLKIFKQFLKFGIVGLSNSLIFLGVYYICIYFGMHYFQANTAGFILSVTNAYVWNSVWVFKGSTEGKKITIIKLFISYLLTFLLSNIFLFLFINILGISKIVAPIINICITTPVNFILNKVWAFKH